MIYNYDKNSVRVFNNRMGFYKTERQLSFIENRIKGQGLSILDIGGGNGRLSVPLANMGHKLTVVDISATALRLLKNECKSNVDCIQSDFMEIQELHTFDIVIAVDCMKYMTEYSYEIIFSKVFRLVKANGIFIFSDINARSWRNQLRMLVGRNEKYNIQPCCGYALALEKAGFNIEEVIGYCWMPVVWNSNSPLVPLFKKIEDYFILKRWISQSPWLLFAAIRG